MPLIFVDCEARGGCPATGQLTEFGAVEYKSRKAFHGILEPLPGTAYASSGDLTVVIDKPDVVFKEFDTWLAQWHEHPVFVSDNCLRGTSRIVLAEDRPDLYSFKPRHKTVEIREVVHKKAKVKVLSLNLSTMSVEAKEVINWVYNEGTVNTWVKIFTRLNQNVPSFTKDHKIWTKQHGWTPAENLKSGDVLLQVDRQPNNDQMQLLLGSLMGDAALDKPHPRGRSWYVGHSNKGLVEFKLKIIGDLSTDYKIHKCRNNRGYSSPDGILYTIRTKTLRCLADTGNLLSTAAQLDWRGIAIWYADDGSLIEKTCKHANNTVSARFHTECLSESENRSLANIMQEKTGLDWRVTKARKYSILTLGKESSYTLFEKITPYLCHAVAYKVPTSFRHLIATDEWNCRGSFAPFEKEVTRVEMVLNNESAKEQGSYCIEVEDNHNFFTTTGLVSNCAFDWMWLCDGFHRYLGRNPFGWSGRRISDFYAGLTRNWSNTQKWKRWRKTPHDHNPVHDALGNLEAWEYMMEKMKAGEEL